MHTAKYWLELCAGEMKRAGLFFGHGTDNEYDEAAWMLLHVLRQPLDGSFNQWDVILGEAQQEELKTLLSRRINERLPLAYLTGEARFCGLDFKVTPQVLIPRSPIAELIVEKFSPWLDPHDGSKVLDMCTGGGCIAIAMAVHMPECHVDAVDISTAALQVAAENVERHGLEDRVSLIHSDLFTALGGKGYDLIVSNPPYVSATVFDQLPAEYKAEPASGLVSGDDGLDIVLKILDAAAAHLNQRGVLVVEVGESAESLQRILPRTPFFWLDFESGGDGIFLLEYDQLVACRGDVRAVLEHRNNV